MDLPSPSQSSFINNNRCCFCIPYSWQKVRASSFSSSQHNSEKTLRTRGINALKEIREWSEIVAGPRWKTFIRKFNRNKSFGHKSGKFQYDPLDYALNFDDRPLENGDSEMENEYMVRNFSSRYVSPRTMGPIGAKTTSDHGRGVAGSNLV